MDSKLQEILLDYGLEGYGLYWYCLEMIVNKIDVDNLTFELEHDARIIARNTGSTTKKISEMMLRFVELDLFQNSEGRVTCLKLLQRLDKSMTSNVKFRNMLTKAKESHDSVMIEPDLVMQDKITLQEITQEEITLNNKEILTETATPKKVIKRFIPPTIDQVMMYCNERNNSVDANTFVDHYIANGWMRGKTKVKDWKACVRTWEKNATQPTQARYASNQKQSVVIDNDNTDWMNTQSFSDTLEGL